MCDTQPDIVMIVQRMDNMCIKVCARTRMFGRMYHDFRNAFRKKGVEPPGLVLVFEYRTPNAVAIVNAFTEANREHRKPNDWYTVDAEAVLKCVHACIVDLLNKGVKNV